uniref:ethanolamine-phosphate cytidylyltransferase n=1 Tax=Caenorhabditis japonica TaxID=281687 RepID=A0A8R1DGY4_CAEJA
MLKATEQGLTPDGEKKKARVYADGCFDFVHFSNARLLWPAKQYGRKLIVGIHSDDELDNNGILPIFTDEERYRLISAIRWVDEAFDDAPFQPEVSTLNQLDCDIIAIPDISHPTTVEMSRYEDIRSSERAKQYVISEHVTDQEVAGRLMLVTKTHHMENESILEFRNSIFPFCLNPSNNEPVTTVSLYKQNYTLSPLVIGKKPKTADKIVYVSGAFDLFHAGHLAFLEAAKELGDFLIVGVVGDDDVNEEKGTIFPVMNLLERTLNVASLKIVDEVIVGVPAITSTKFIDFIKADTIAVYSETHTRRFSDCSHLGITVQVTPDYDATTEEVLERITSRRVAATESDEIAMFTGVPLNNNQH